MSSEFSTRMFGQQVSLDIWNDKYRYQDEATPRVSMARVCEGVYAKDSNWAALALEAMTLGEWQPAGRIQAGAGTPNVVTWINCFVCRDIDDSMDGIMTALKDAALTMQQGGGIGMNFGTLRPRGALLRRTGAVASGPLPFMDMWHSMCSTIMSAGSRRGAMMGVMTDDHPDLPEFIKAKHQAGRLTNFNVSVLVTDAFMDAVKNDNEWALGFNVPPAAPRAPLEIIDKDGEDWFVYEKVGARELWDTILKSTHEFSEPGVIFIDRVNDSNNLQYLEHISATNPCGEQPLPPYGACNLGHVNLAALVKFPFSKEKPTEFDYARLEQVVSIGVRFLDNVIDTTGYPLKEQEREEIEKRRIGLGITGLGSMLAMMGIKYGSAEANGYIALIMQSIAVTAYKTSIRLAKEKGHFAQLDKKRHARTPFMKKMWPLLGEMYHTMYEEYGIRNGVILSVAPTGTTSIYYGNVSGGLEPIFALEYKRKIRQSNDMYTEHVVQDYAWKLFKEIHGNPTTTPDFFTTATSINPIEHLSTLALVQEWIDASVSKTINCPEDITFDAFKHVYTVAYNSGCKGCTTYRPSATRGSVLSEIKKEEKVAKPLPKRPPVLSGTTYKVTWPFLNQSIYVTINNDKEGRPYEMFINSRDSKGVEWMTALTLMISAIMRREANIDFIPEELARVMSPTEGVWIDQKFYGSLVARIAEVIRQHTMGAIPLEAGTQQVVVLANPPQQSGAQICPQCSKPSYIAREGCQICTECDYSSCG